MSKKRIDEMSPRELRALADKKETMECGLPSYDNFSKAYKDLRKSLEKTINFKISEKLPVIFRDHIHVIVSVSGFGILYNKNLCKEEQFEVTEIVYNSDLSSDDKEYFDAVFDWCFGEMELKNTLIELCENEPEYKELKAEVNKSFENVKKLLESIKFHPKDRETLLGDIGTSAESGFSVEDAWDSFREQFNKIFEDMV